MNVYRYRICYQLTKHRSYRICILMFWSCSQYTAISFVVQFQKSALICFAKHSNTEAGIPIVVGRKLPILIKTTLLLLLLLILLSSPQSLQSVVELFFQHNQYPGVIITNCMVQIFVESLKLFHFVVCKSATSHETQNFFNFF